MNVRVEIDTRALERKLRRMPRDIERKVLPEAETAGATVISEAAQGLAPVDTGRLRESIHVDKSEVVAGGNDAPYATYVEYGTLYTPAQPFLEPALMTTRTLVIRMFARIFRRRFRRLRAR